MVGIFIAGLCLYLAIAYLVSDYSSLQLSPNARELQPAPESMQAPAAKEEPGPNEK